MNRSRRPARPSRTSGGAIRRQPTSRSQGQPNQRRLTYRCLFTRRALSGKTRYAIVGVNTVCYVLWKPMQALLKRLPALRQCHGVFEECPNLTHLRGRLDLVALVMECPDTVVNAFIEACHPTRRELLRDHIMEIRRQISTAAIEHRTLRALGRPARATIAELVRGLPKVDGHRGGPVFARVGPLLLK